MSRKPVNLALHRNTVERKKGRQQAQTLLSGARGIFRENDVRAYAFVAMDADGSVHALWDTGSVMPAWSFPTVMMKGLEIDMQSSGVDETWRPNLPLDR